ncbi:MAG TPA: YbgF trimerization domain-containing protein, partial [Rhodanobacteraceae bacterium]|nr:YbgF trimerization domain-containing protein [Rhodanobacteraceae bacterium]
MNPSRNVRSGLLAAAVLAIAAVAVPAQAQRLSLAERVDRLEQQQSSGGNAVELVNQVSALQSQVQTLQGQVEELKHQLDEAKQRNKDQYIDLDSRIGRIEGRAPGGAPAPGPGAARDNNAPPPDIELGAGRAEEQPQQPPPGASAPHGGDVPERARQNVGELRADERGDLG